MYCSVVDDEEDTGEGMLVMMVMLRGLHSPQAHYSQPGPARLGPVTIL